YRLIYRLDAHVTLTSSQKTGSSKQSSSVSSDFASKFLILENVPLAIDEVASMMNVKSRQEESTTQTSSLFIVPVTAISETATAHATTVPSTISMITPPPQLTTPSLAPTTVPTATLIPALPDFSSLFGFVQREVSDFATPVVQSIINESLENVVLAKSFSQLKSKYKAIVSLTEFELKKFLLDKIKRSESYKIALEHKELYEGHTNKDAEPPKGSKSKETKTSSSKGTKSQPKSSAKSVQAEEPVFETADTEMPQDQGGDTEDQPIVEATPMYISYSSSFIIIINLNLLCIIDQNFDNVKVFPYGSTPLETYSGEGGDIDFTIMGGENFKLDDLENFFRQRYPAIEVVDHVDKNDNIDCYKKKDIVDGLQGVSYIIANGGDEVKLFEKFFTEGYRTTQC
nr:hypothetical protein [Tanacetum cinerariifolium]